MDGRRAIDGFLLLACVLAACGSTPPAACRSDDECDGRCVDGVCVPERDAGTADAGADAGCACGPGERCEGARCVSECPSPQAVPCAAGSVCDVLSGACVPEGTPGILAGPGEACGAGVTCLPGSECDVDGSCVAAPPCAAISCAPDSSVCWGRACRAERPAGACAPAPLDRINQDDFLRGGDGGAVDIEFDDVCTAYTVTIISGADYLRQLTPDGALTQYGGVTNLDMGEVAVLRLPGGEFGGGDGVGQVALTYVCCPTCGCDGADPQGVAHLVRGAASELPMVVTASASMGEGPFGDRVLDAGPYGLTWGRDNTLYVGNVAAEGDLVRADLDTGGVAEIVRLPARVHASTTFTPRSLLVAVDGGDVHLVATDGSTTAAWASIGADVTSLVRDPFTGRVYVASGGAILELDDEGTMVGELASGLGPGRLAYAPDGHLYYLVVGWGMRAEVQRFALPTTL